MSITALRTQLTQILAAYPDVTTSISLANVATDVQYSFGSSVSMRGASTTKIITAIDFLHEVELGNASLNETIDGESAQSLLQEMVEETSVTTSDAAWYDLLGFLSYNQVTEYGQTIGLHTFDAYYNTLTASDEATVLQKLSDGKLIKNEYVQLLYSFMQHTGDEDLIPAALPKGATVYDKYGYLYGYLHDAALITYKGQTFVLVIYTNNSDGTLDDYSSRVQLFHSITKAVVNYEAA